MSFYLVLFGATFFTIVLVYEGTCIYLLLTKPKNEYVEIQMFSSNNNELKDELDMNTTDLKNYNELVKLNLDKKTEQTRDVKLGKQDTNVNMYFEDKQPQKQNTGNSINNTQSQKQNTGYSINNTQPQKQNTGNSINNTQSQKQNTGYSINNTQSQKQNTGNSINNTQPQKQNTGNSLYNTLGNIVNCDGIESRITKPTIQKMQNINDSFLCQQKHAEAQQGTIKGVRNRLNENLDAQILPDQRYEPLKDQKVKSVLEHRTVRGDNKQIINNVSAAKKTGELEKSEESRTGMLNQKSKKEPEKLEESTTEISNQKSKEEPKSSDEQNEFRIKIVTEIAKRPKDTKKLSREEKLEIRQQKLNEILAKKEKDKQLKVLEDERLNEKRMKELETTRLLDEAIAKEQRVLKELEDEIQEQIRVKELEANRLEQESKTTDKNDGTSTGDVPNTNLNIDCELTDDALESIKMNHSINLLPRLKCSGKILPKRKQSTQELKSKEKPNDAVYNNVVASNNIPLYNPSLNDATDMANIKDSTSVPIQNLKKGYEEQFEDLLDLQDLNAISDEIYNQLFNEMVKPDVLNDNAYEGLFTDSEDSSNGGSAIKSESISEPEQTTRQNNNKDKIKGAFLEELKKKQNEFQKRKDRKDNSLKADIEQMNNEIEKRRKENEEEYERQCEERKRIAEERELREKAIEKEHLTENELAQAERERKIAKNELIKNNAQILEELNNFIKKEKEKVVAESKSYESAFKSQKNKSIYRILNEAVTKHKPENCDFNFFDYIKINDKDITATNLLKEYSNRQQENVDKNRMVAWINYVLINHKNTKWVFEHKKAVSKEFTSSTNEQNNLSINVLRKYYVIPNKNEKSLDINTIFPLSNQVKRKIAIQGPILCKDAIIMYAYTKHKTKNKDEVYAHNLYYVEITKKSK